MQKPKISFILLSCCTCMRPKIFFSCLNSLKQTILPQNIQIELLIIDNDKEGSALNVVRDFSKKTEIKCHYFIEEERGLSFARNRLLQEALNLDASHIMIFDDDEVFTPEAIVKHIELYNMFNEPIISSGTVINKFEKNTPAYIKRNIVFKQKTTKHTGQIKSSCASGNVFLPLEIVKKHNLSFSKEYVFMGGEDGQFFARLSSYGYKIVQNSDSLLYEIVTPSRANINYVIKKSYYNGFAGSYFKFKSNNQKIKKYIYILKQSLLALIDVILAIPALITGISSFVNFLTMSVRAVGKIRGTISNKPLEFYKEILNE